MSSHPYILSAGSVTGDKVVNPQGEDLGKIEEIMLDTSENHIAYAVLSFGGFLGLGDKYFALPWEALRLDSENKRFILDVPKETLENAQGFDKDNWPNFADRDFGRQTYDHYSIAPYWS